MRVPSQLGIDRKVVTSQLLTWVRQLLAVANVIARLGHSIPLLSGITNESGEDLDSSVQLHPDKCLHVCIEGYDRGAVRVQGLLYRKRQMVPIRSHRPGSGQHCNQSKQPRNIRVTQRRCR